MSEEHALRARHRDWEAAINAGDVDHYVSLLTEDVVWLPPGQPAVIGRASLREWLAPLFAAFQYQCTITLDWLHVAGSWAAQRGTFTTRLTPRQAGTPVTHNSTYFLLWRLDVDGVWRIERYVDTGE